MKKYFIWNNTDGIPAHWDEFDTIPNAEEWIKNKREEFRKNQGYYRTNRLEKIDPNDIWYEIKEIEEEN